MGKKTCPNLYRAPVCTALLKTETPGSVTGESSGSFLPLKEPPWAKAASLTFLVLRLPSWTEQLVDPPLTRAQTGSVDSALEPVS